MATTSCPTLAKLCESTEYGAPDAVTNHKKKAVCRDKDGGAVILRGIYFQCFVGDESFYVDCLEHNTLYMHTVLLVLYIDPDIYENGNTG